MRVIFTSLARQKLEDAVRYYELEYSGLGYEWHLLKRQVSVQASLRTK